MATKYQLKREQLIKTRRLIEQLKQTRKAEQLDKKVSK